MTAAPATSFFMEPRVKVPKAQSSSSSSKNSIDPVFLVIIVCCIQFIQLAIKKKFALRGDVIDGGVVEFCNLSSKSFLLYCSKKSLAFVMQCNVMEKPLSM